MSVAETLSEPSSPRAAETMRDILNKQRAAFLNDALPPAEVRIERIDRCIGLLVDHKDEIAAAVSRDFGHRSFDETHFADTMVGVSALKHAKAHLRQWMRPERRTPEFPFGLLGGKASVHYQPLGVVGVIVPWNYPVLLAFAPLAGILAAGNRCMLKPSEYTPSMSALLGRMIASVFTPEEVAVVQGGADVGEAFSRLPFDHLLFTGATSVGRHVMRAAADNLTPLTLELGGKSPVIVGESAHMDLSATRIMAGKMQNAGQICLAPDYVFVPKTKADAFVKAAQSAAAKMYPTMKDNPDYTSVINQRHYDRLKDLLDDAKARGARLIEINPANEDFSQQEHLRMPPTIVLDPTDDMKVMKEEIFGPILPIKTYTSVDETIAYINDRPRPLGLYYFGNNAAEREHVLSRTTSGGVTINDVILHVAQEDLPFGGVGPSGMGAYHGREGFKTFSHARAVFSQAKPDLTAMVRPPYGVRMRGFVSQRIKR